jgi:hypothetical protein
MNDKRADNDRRVAEIGPPHGWRERRRTVERRRPEVLEIAFSEWLAYRRVGLVKESSGLS